MALAAIQGSSGAGFEAGEGLVVARHLGEIALGGCSVEGGEDPGHGLGQAGADHPLDQAVDRHGHDPKWLAGRRGDEAGDLCRGVAPRAGQREGAAALGRGQRQCCGAGKVIAGDVGDAAVSCGRVPAAGGKGLRHDEEEVLEVPVIAQDGPSGDVAGGDGPFRRQMFRREEHGGGLGRRHRGVEQVLHARGLGRCDGGGRLFGAAADGVGGDQKRPLWPPRRPRRGWRAESKSAART